MYVLCYKPHPPPPWPTSKPWNPSCHNEDGMVRLPFGSRPQKKQGNKKDSALNQRYLKNPAHNLETAANPIK